MKDRLPTLIAIMLLLALVAGTWWAADYTQRSIPIEAARRLTHEPDSWAERFVMLRTDAQGVAANRMEGDHMLHFPDDDSYEVTRARAVGQRAGTPVTVGTSDIAIMDQDGQRITMRGNAKLHRAADAEREAMDVSSEELILLPDDNRAYTDLPAKVVHGKSVMHGTGMQYDNNTRQLRVLSASDVKISSQDTQQGRRDRPPQASDAKP
ncbi:LPS export ABC transporter periplasmic protein LptC [Pusillimonas sp. CC-YST705]|uniref:LPS export ABC transporter periplasmic protein LptC n=1 Tax=Mesopusillimonas faecipullorum TaxID=2755040 RepID=A0ABS8CCB8_9BURK|nr:LPS export ABC transporter periplasmic protein LptC [Mesopusillimonas faecipullorum]MCB5363681.1 LPS export ABC transporter periplasmic protein LptC [Mesopusillimonas faecipullorum]